MSNAQTWAETFAPIQARDRENALRATWGHLAPEKNKSYQITILFMSSEYGGNGATIIDMELKDGLEDSPWLYDAVNDYIWKHRPEKAGVYKIKGTFRNFRFYGKPKSVYSL